MFGRNKKTLKAIEALQTEILELRSLLSEQSAQISSNRVTSESVANRLSGLETRVSGMGSELARQLHELGDEIEQLSKRAEDDGVAEIIATLKATQVRLASEQARYEITFRQDLAQLADQLLRRNR